MKNTLTKLFSYSGSYWTAWSATLFFFAGFYALLIPLPVYLSDIGLPDWQIGVILGAFGVASLVVRPLAGVLTDSLGYRPVILLGSVTLAVGAIGAGVVESPIIHFLLRILQAAGYVAFSTAAYSIVPDLVANERRGAALSLFGAAANLAIAIAPAAVSAALEALALRDAFLLSGGLALLAGALVWLGIPSDVSERSEFELRKLIQIPRTLWMPMLTTLFFGVGFGVHFQFLPLLADRRGLGSAGLAYSVYGIAIILTRLTTGRLLDRPDRREVLPPAALLMASGLSLFAIAEANWALLAGSVLMAAGGGIFHPTLIAIHVDNVPERGRATAGFYLAFDLGIGLGSWLLSLVLEQFGLGVFFLSAAAVTLIALVPIGKIPMPERRSLVACCA